MAGSSYRGVRAKKSLGQNFLIDQNIQKKIVDALDPGPADEVVEIGPGLGALTSLLADRVGRLTLIELDNELAARLGREYEEDADVTLIHQDVLTVDIAAALDSPSDAKVIGNIPYNITTPIIFHLLEVRPRLGMIVLMVQKEVADRMLADPGSKAFGALAAGVQANASVERVINVSRGCFRPAPDVDSSVIRITPHDPPILPDNLSGPFRNLTRAAFAMRRKQFQRILRDTYSLSPDQISALEASTGFDLRARPETFSATEFIRLAGALETL